MRRSAATRRPAPLKHFGLESYDVRVRRELAHRRFVVSLFRQALRLVSLHALDAGALIAAVALAWNLTGFEEGRALTAALVAFVLVGLNVRGAYSPGDARRDSQRLLTGVLIGMLLAFIPVTLPGARIHLGFMAVFGLASTALLILERQLVDAVVHQAYVRGFGLRRAILVCRAAEVKDVMAGLSTGPRGSRRTHTDDQYIVGYVTPDDTRDADALGTLKTIQPVLNAQDVSEVVVATSVRNETIASLAELCFEQGVRVLVIPPAVHAGRGWAELTHVGRWPAYQLHPARLELPALVLKRATDLVLASIGVLLAAPVMVLIGASIKLESDGPIFFRQRRVGLGGREFMMWKFRSMLSEAEARREEIAHLNPYGDGRLFKLRQDPRITRVGRVLRRFSLDELPQLFNILAGHMSLVGPRPPLPSEVKMYEARHYVRLSVVPGLTGPWQVNGRNLITDFEEVVRLEREYIESWSLRSDLEIMVRTLGVVLSGKGAY